MPFCATCGTHVEGRFCAKCGSPATDAAPTDFGSTGAPNPPGAEPYSAGAAGAGLAENMAAALCYLAGFITGILFLAIAPYNHNRNIRFHAWQSIFYFAFLVAFWIVLTIFSIIMPWFISAILGILSVLVWLGSLILWIVLMIKAYNGQRWKLPVIGDLAEKQAG